MRGGLGEWQSGCKYSYADPARNALYFSLSHDGPGDMLFPFFANEKTEGYNPVDSLLRTLKKSQATQRDRPVGIDIPGYLKALRYALSLSTHSKRKMLLARS